MTMVDANRAALRQHEAEEDRAQERWESFGETAIQSVVDDILDGRLILHVGYPPRTINAAYFIDESWLTADEEAAIYTLSDSAVDIIARMRKRLAAEVRQWCEESAAGKDLVNDRINDMQEDEAYRHKEES